MRRDSKTRNSIVQLRKIPHSQTKFGFTTGRIWFHGHVAHAREESNATGSVDGKIRNAINW